MDVLLGDMNYLTAKMDVMDALLGDMTGGISYQKKRGGYEMRYIVDGTEYESVTEAAQAIVDELGDDEYDKILDKTYDEASICGHDFCASYALKEVDETAWRCGFADWSAEKTEEIEETLANMEPGDEDTLYGCSVECVGDEEAVDWFDEDEYDNDCCRGCPLNNSCYTAVTDVRHECTEWLKNNEESEVDEE